MQDIKKQFPAIFDPADVEIKCALENCTHRFLYGDGYSISYGYHMPGDRNKGAFGPDCVHVFCSHEHAMQGLYICLTEHMDHSKHA